MKSTGKKLFGIVFSVCILLLLLRINISEVDAKDMKLTVKSFNITGSAPKTVGGVSYIPLRSVFESLGWEIGWEPGLKRVTCTNKERSIVFTSGSKELEIDGEYSMMDNPLLLIDNKSFVPGRFITQQLGVKIRWNRKDNLIIVSDSDASSVTVNGGSNIIIAGDGIIVNIFEPFGEDTLDDMISYSDRLLKLNSPAEALLKYKEIIENISFEDMPEMYARVMNNTGNAYSMLAEINNPKSNMLRAVDSYRKAADFYKDTGDIPDYSIILNNLANACRLMFDITGEKIYMDNVIGQYKEALKYYTCREYPLDYALIQYNMGMTYKQLESMESAGECWKEARSVYEEALNTYTLDEDPEYYAVIQYNLGNIYRELCRTYNKEETAQKSRECYMQALKVWTAESSPVNYAKVHRCLGCEYMDLYKNESTPESLDKARAEYEESLGFYTPGQQPYNYALTSYELGNIYMLLSEARNEEKYMKAAISAYKNSLKIFNTSEYPGYYRDVIDKLKDIEIKNSMQGN